MSAPAGYGRSALMGCGIAFSILPAMFVALRFYARHISHTKYGIDDWMLIPAMIGCMGLGGVEIFAVLKGRLGQHPSIPGDLQLLNPLTNFEMSTYEKCRYIFEIVGTIELTIIKISILLFYRRLFAIQTVKIIDFKTANSIMIALVSVWGFSFTIALIFQCNPVSILWETFEFDYLPYCVNQESLYLALAVTDVILDFFTFILPLPPIYSLRLAARKRLAVIGIFLLGSIAIAAGLTRCAIFGQTRAFDQQNAMIFFEDITFYTSGDFFWTHIESAVAIIGACLPTLSPLVSCVQSRRSSKMRTSVYGYGVSADGSSNQRYHHHQKIGAVGGLGVEKLSGTSLDESEFIALHSNAASNPSGGDISVGSPGGHLYAIGADGTIPIAAASTSANTLVSDQQGAEAVFQHPAGVGSEAHVETATLHTVPSFGIVVRDSFDLSGEYV